MRHLASLQLVKEIQPIEGADKIEKIRIKDWWVVSQTGTFKVDEPCVYFEIDSLLPSNNPVFNFLSRGTKEKTMLIDGKEYKGYRLKTIKLRGQISQGLALSITEFPTLVEQIRKHLTMIGDDVSDILGIVKYEQPIPAQLAGKIKGYFPSYIPKTDEERIQNCSDILERHKGEIFYITEKIDGCSSTFFKHEGKFGVCSRNLELEETEDNTFWKIVKEFNLAEKLPDEFVLQGEIIGEGVQKNPLKLKGQKLFVFNVYDLKNGRYLDFEDFVKFCEDMGIPSVPIVNSAYTLNNSAEELLEMANGKSLLSPELDREGLVFRPIIEASDIINGSFSRLSFKVVSNNYLLNEE